MDSPEPPYPSPDMPPRLPEPASPPGVLSPSFSRAPFSARRGAAAAAAAADSSEEEHPCVMLLEWWLERLEGDQRKIAIAGFIDWNKGFTSAAIVKRHEPLTLEDEKGFVVFIDGTLNIPRMRENGFSIKICEQFLIGFPYWWKTWDSYMESHLNSSNTSDSQVDTALFYLRQFQLGNFLKTAGSSLMMKLRKKGNTFSSSDMDPFMKYSSSSNETHRCDKYSSGNDIAEKEKSAASNDVCEGSAGVANKVDNVEVGLDMSRISQEGGYADCECNACLTPTEKCKRNKKFSSADMDSFMKSSSLSNETWRIDEYTCRKDISEQENSAVPNDVYEGSADVANKVDNVEAGLIMSSISQERGPADTECNECLTPTEKFTTDDTSNEAGNQTDMHPDAREHEADRSYEGTAVASLKNQCYQKNRPKTSNKKAHQSVLTRGKAKSSSISTPESLKMKRTRSGRMVVPPLDKGRQWIVYDSDGLISGVARSPSPVKGSKSATPVRKKRRPL